MRTKPNMKEFTFSSFRKLLSSFRTSEYNIQSFYDHLQDRSNKNLILRHDVDRFPKQTLQMAKMEAEMGINSTYYFRIVPAVFQDQYLKEVTELGHEIGYHYEDLTLCKGSFQKAIDSFERNLDKVRKYYPVKTICMHGSPASPWDNKKIWDKYNYRDYGIIADTSIDIDYDKVFYITDNGFGWNKTRTSVRDKVKTKFDIPIKNTNHLIELIEENKLPNNIMLNAHPDTFFDPGIKWLLNYGFIKSKNIIKWAIVKSGIYK